MARHSPWILFVALAACAGSDSKEAGDKDGLQTADTGTIVVPGDADGDGFAAGDDCDDDDPTSYPGAPERCDGRDNDCDGSDVEPTDQATVLGGDDWPTISEAIAAAGPGGTVTVCPGTYGEALLISDDLTLIGLDDPTIDALGGGSVIDVLGGTVHVEGFTLTGGTGSADGPLVTNGGGVNAYNATGPVDLVDCRITDNLAELGGGVVFGAAGGSIQDSEVTLNVAGSVGGGVYLSGPVTISGTTIDGNVAANQGGGIAVGDDEALQIDTSVVSGNTAASGAGVYAFAGAGIDGDTDTEISDNVATGSGGGVVLDVDVGWTGGRILRNDADVGGGILASSGAEIDGAEVAENTATSGAGLYLGGSVELTATTVHDNTATVSAGGAYLSEGDVVADATTELRGNSAFESAGGLFIIDATWTGGTIAENDAEFGGGVYISGLGASGVAIQDAVIADNTALESGGGVYVRGPWTLTGCDVDGNTSNNRAGGLYVYNATGSADDTTFSSNAAAERGGGIYLAEGSVATLTDCTVDRNQALRGAGLYLNEGASYGPSTLTMVNGVVEANGNSTTISGGGARVTGGTLVSTCVDWASGVTENQPDDAYVEGIGGYLGYDTCETFSCTAGVDCNPLP